MSERSPSRTAMGVAVLRAAHLLLDGEPKILADPVAPRLLDDAARERLRARPEEVQTQDARALRAHVLTRNRYAEEQLEAAVARGVRQYVILGAGLDSFAYRQPAWARDLAIFEVDHPASQAEKRQRLAAAGIAAPPNLRMVAIDFERTRLRDGLVGGGVDPAAPAFVSCLGVLVYLDEAAVDAIFAFVASLPRSSEIVFTFSTGPSARAAALATKVARAGEPFRSQLVAEELAPKLTAMGFSAVTILAPEEAEARYFAGRTDGLAAPRRALVASATV